MARITGIDLLRGKRVEIGLICIFGVRRSTTQEILNKTGIGYNARVEDLTEAEEAALRDEIDHYTVEGDLRRDVAVNVKRLREINCYHGIRHRHGLSIRGQKTRTNARTRKDPKKLVAKEG